MKTITHTLFILATLCSLQVHAQVKLQLAPDFVKGTELSEERFQELLSLTEAAVNNYATAGRIYDAGARRVTNESIKVFNDLFTPAAEIVKDYVEFPPRELVDFRDYSIEVFNMLSDKGVQFHLTSAELQSMNVRTLGSSTFYVPVVKATKVVYAYLDRYGVLKQSTSGLSIDLLITFDIYAEDLSSAKIAKINHGVSVKPADDYNRILAIYAMGGSSALNPSFSSYWADQHANSTMNLSGNFNWSIGVDYMNDRFISSKSNPNRSIGFSAGLRFSAIAMEADVPEYTTRTSLQTIQIDGTEVLGERSVSTGNIRQSVNISTLSLPIGIDYKLRKTRTMIVAIHGRIVPSLLLGGNSSLSGTLLHEVYFPEYDLLFSDPNSGSGNWGAAADAGSRTFELESEPTLQNFVLGFELSPTAYFNFEDSKSSWGILVGADIGYVPGSFFVHQPIEGIGNEPLSLSADLPPLTSAYLNDLSSLFFGIRVGLFQRAVTQP